MELIEGKVVAKKIREELQEEVAKLKDKGIIPKLAVILVGDDPASKIYVRNKNKACEKIGIEFEEHFFSSDISQTKLDECIDSLNANKEINGILLQYPIPKHLDVDEAFRRISPEKDVDGFNPINVGKLYLGQDTFISCTPYGIMKMLEHYNINPEGKHAVVIGRSNIVGKPMAQCLLKANSTVTICHSKTQNLKEITKQADILVAAIGKPKFVTEEMIKNKSVVIDVGINRLEDGSIVGDVDFENVSKKANYISPVPGGVGPMTITMLLNNVVKATKEQNNI